MHAQDAQERTWAALEGQNPLVAEVLALKSASWISSINFPC